MNEEQRLKAKQLLGAMSSPKEERELLNLDLLKALQKEVQELRLATQVTNQALENTLLGMVSSIQEYRASLPKLSAGTTAALKGFTEALSNKLDEIKGTITTSYEKNKPVNAAGVYKDMINQLSAIDESIKKKPVPVWNWPQYASVGVRDRSFRNVNPATDHLDLNSYDYISLAQASLTDTYTFKTGGASGTTTATVVITYTSSAKTTISTVVKTPVTVQ